jgi:hypothetical protein
VRRPPRRRLVALAAMASLFVACAPAVDDPETSGRPSVVSSTYDLPPPDYVLDLSTFAFELDARRVVLSVSGEARLTEGRRAGDRYVIDQGTLPERPTFGDYDDVFRKGTPQPLQSPPPAIAGTTLLTVGTSLSEPVRRTIVVSRRSDGVVTYQALRVNLSAPDDGHSFTPR